MEQDMLYMLRAIELASLGQYSARPNPMVGAVIVYRGRIIGEGYHHAWGQAHAEVMAINAVKDKTLLAESTIYVSLEPCSHYGKTPPCAELIIRMGIPRVVLAMQDPYHEVSGRGVAMLRAAGVEVQEWVQEDKALELNRAFVTAQIKHRPFVTLKWAESRDGYIDRLRESVGEVPEVFSSPYRQRLVHRIRASHQAILVGYRTALLDDPCLTNRYWGMAQPVRLVLDPALALPETLALKQETTSKTIILYDPERCASSKVDSCTPYLCYEAIPFGGDWISSLCRLLYTQGIQSLLVEGGGKTLQAFIDAECYDAIEIEKSDRILGEGVPAPHLPKVSPIFTTIL